MRCRSGRSPEPRHRRVGGVAPSLQLLVRWYYGVEVIVANHEVAGLKYAVVGVAYAVLLAFVVVGV
ncbi:MAG: hypothetical protein R3D30_09830 [Hyphomicrobiales bacterium]